MRRNVTIFLLGLAEMIDVDMQGGIEAKIAKDAARVYQRLPNGVSRDIAAAGLDLVRVHV